MEKIIAAVVLNTEGVSRLVNKKSVRIDKTKEDGVYTAEVHIIVNYGVNMPSVAWNVQRNVKKEAADVLGINLKAIDIHVDGIDFPEGETTDEQN
ncbi:MAG: Asp23/Gls24 family envelope stress response protein [Firmicutes bacterium]|nr:Asp23/Gls24 family envelope stress response protein [Bacillota bacterium]